MWSEETWSPDGHRCDPGKTYGNNIVFFGCIHCGRTWVLQHAAGQWSSTVGDGKRNPDPIALRFREIYIELFPSSPSPNQQAAIAVFQRLINEGAI